MYRENMKIFDKVGKFSLSFYETVRTVVKNVRNEAEFEYALNKEIEKVAEVLNIQLLSKQQYTLATGRADAVYNRFIIEYEPPGSLRSNLNHGHTKHAVQQVKDYIVGLAKKEKHDRDRLLGVAFDGYYYIFVRYHDGHFIVEEPLEVTRESTERFLRSLFSLSSGRALIPENLVDDFGHQNVISHQVTRALYNALEKKENNLTGKLYEQWKLFFSEVAGFEAAGGQLKHKKELRSFAKGMGLKPDAVDAPRFFFAIQTYFSFLVKNIARLVLQAHAGGSLGTTPLTTIANLKGDALRHELEKMESGGIFRTLGLKNLLEGDFFAWYLNAWDENVEEALRQVLARLAEYNPATVQDDPYSARDLLKKLYHYLLPREIRHDLGEFYTPDWLAERLLNQLGEPLFQMPKPGRRQPKPGKRLLDPACGSGTFLILAARALKANCQALGLAEADTLEVILNSLAGIDLNPLAVMAARVNFLLTIADLLPYRPREVEIPIYLADSILTPSHGTDLFTAGQRILETAVGPLPVPEVIDTREEMEKLTSLLEEYVTNGFDTGAFIDRCRQELSDVAATPQSEPVLKDLYERLRELHSKGLDGIWARVLKNAFMPLFLEKFDYVVGNPPWINWESLPQAYREQSAPLWHKFKLFVHSGMDTILGKGKKDVSTLMTYAVADALLKDKGKLGFVITQSVWKTSGAAQGFRRFRIGENGASLCVLHVDDLSSLQVFEGASTRTSVFVLKKGLETTYPVPYTYWQKTTRGKGLDYDSTLEEVFSHTKRLKLKAMPVDESDNTSAWITARPKALQAIRRVLGKSDYRAYEGANSGGANGVYWLEILAERPDGLVVVRNVTEGAKRKVESIITEIEPDLLYPLLRGRDVQRWMAKPSLHILMVQDPVKRRGYDEDYLQKNYPKTWAYLKRFERPLRERSGFKRYFTRKEKNGRIVETGPFYSMFNVGDYTFAPWKVVWRYIATEMTSAVVGPGKDKLIIADHRLMIVPVEDDSEAYFICGALNSSIGRFIVDMFIIGTQISTHVLEKLKIPKFDKSLVIHTEVSSLSKRAHEIAPKAYSGDEAAQAELRHLEEQIDRAAARLWGLSEEELQDIQRSLKELKGE